MFLVRYPVFRLLHGYGGDEPDWLRLTQLTRDLQRYSTARYEARSRRT